MRRGSAFFCQLASTDQRRPVGILTNLPTLQSRLFPQWPILERRGDELICKGPTARIVPVCSSTCSVQVNGCRLEFCLLIPVAGRRVLESLFGRRQCGQFRFPQGWVLSRLRGLCCGRLCLWIRIPRLVSVVTGRVRLSVLRLRQDSRLVRMRPRGCTPHGYSGGDGGSRMTGASDGSVRTRLSLIFQFLPLVR